MQNAGGRGIARLAVVAMLPVAVGYGLLATGVASRHGGLTTYAGHSAPAAVVELAAGWALMAAGLWSWSRRPARAAGPLAVIAGLAWFAPDWIGWQTGPGAIRAVALAAQGVTAAALIQL